MKQKNYAVEFWRFCLSMIVALYHAGLCTALYPDRQYFSIGGRAVTFFYVLSGFLFACSFENESNVDTPIRGALKTMWKKASSFAFIWYTALFSTMAIRIHYYGMTQEQTQAWLKSNWAEFFMLNSVFYNENHINGPTWYISGLILACGLYYMIFALARKYLHMSPLWVALVCSLSINTLYYSYDVILLGSPWVTASFALFPAGVVAYYLYHLLKRTFGAAVEIVLQFTELVLLIALGFLLLDPALAEVDNRWLVLVSAGVVAVTFQNRTFVTKLLNRPFSAFLGKISLGIYLSHMIVMVHWGWGPPFDVATAPLKAYLCISAEILVVGASLTALDIAQKRFFRAACRDRQSKKDGCDGEKIRKTSF